MTRNHLPQTLLEQLPIENTVDTYGARDIQ
jgi:hypothetical protein